MEKKESDAAKAREAELEAARASDKEEKEKDENGKPEKGGEVEIKMIRWVAAGGLEETQSISWSSLLRFM